MRKFEVCLAEGTYYVEGDGIAIENGFVCIYEENYDPEKENYYTFASGRTIIHTFNSGSVISVKDVTDPNEKVESKQRTPKGIETLLVTVAVEAGVDVAQVSKQVMKQLISQIENL